MSRINQEIKKSTRLSVNGINLHFVKNFKLNGAKLYAINKRGSRMKSTAKVCLNKGAAKVLHNAIKDNENLTVTDFLTVFKKQFSPTQFNLNLDRLGFYYANGNPVKGHTQLNKIIDLEAYQARRSHSLLDSERKKAWVKLSEKEEISVMEAVKVMKSAIMEVKEIVWHTSDPDAEEAMLYQFIALLEEELV